MSLTDLLPLVLALGLALVFTPAVRALARRWKVVAQPRADRWHQKPTALLGGIAICAAVVVTSLLTLAHTAQTLTLLGTSVFLFLVGFIDDLRGLKPYQKLIGQVMGAAGLLAVGLYLPWTPWLLVNWAITIFWVVGITNALNLLDNMDGLAGGIAAIASVFLGFNCLANGQVTEALLLGVLAAALVGFLVYNSNPASIFMGDCGSMFIGFFLAGAALLDPAGGRSRSFLPVLAVPVLVLFIPIFDVCLVTVMRKMAGRALSQGGRDHTSHRLVRLGLSERRAVLLLYALAVASGVVALVTREASVVIGVLFVAGFTLALTLLGIYIARVKVYAEGDQAARGPGVVASFFIDLSYKRRLFEVVLDVVLIGVAYLTANQLFYGSGSDEGLWALFASPLPLLVFVKLGAFLVAGVYRGLWRFVGVSDLVVYAKGVALGSVLSALAFLAMYRFEGFSRTVFLLDGVILFLLLAASRGAFRLLRTLLPARPPDGGRRALIYGAGDAGELLLREMTNNPKLGCVPVGFADDDPQKKGKVIHGLRVFGGNGSLGDICKANDVEDVYISSTRFSEERVREIRQKCQETGVGLKRLRLSFETLHGEGDAGAR